MSYSLNKLFAAVGISKQAIHQKRNRQLQRDSRLAELMKRADNVRKECGGLGLRAMYFKLQPDWIGRDRFELLMGQMGYNVKKHKVIYRTTRPGTKVFPNLIEGMVLHDQWQVWQSDTTYYMIGERHYFITTVIDIVDRCIDGFAVHGTLETEANILALRMAIKRGRKKNTLIQIHHSDRGSQYSSNAYLNELRQHGIWVSMGKSGPENAYVERLHNTIKNQYICYWSPATLSDLNRMMKRAVSHYNNQRPHRGIGMHTPADYRKLITSERMHDVHIVHSASRNLDRKSPLMSHEDPIDGPYCRLKFIQNGQH